MEAQHRHDTPLHPCTPSPTFALSSVFHAAWSELQWRLRAPEVRRVIATKPRLHLGSGSRVLPGWTNLDVCETEGVTRWDLSRGLPAPDASVDFIYSEHFVEHLTREQVARMLRDCWRTLRPGAAVRISTPDLDHLVRCYKDKRTDEFKDVDWQPDTPCRLMNEGMRSWGHQFLFDEPELVALLQELGFVHITRRTWRDSPHADLIGLESRPHHDDLILEAEKPRAA